MAHVLVESGLLQDLAQPDVVVRPQRDALVAARRAIRRGAHQVEGADADVATGPGVSRAPRPHQQRELAREVRDACGERDPGQGQRGAEREVVQPVRLEDRNSLPQRCGRKLDVRVGEQEQLAARLPGAEPQRVVLPEPTRRKFANMDDLEARVPRGKSIEDVPGRIR
ncbi:MAG: hypothetical protein O3A06_09125 [Proteobacteria bacterium]|nr:hypothetical protein [Pseudomonadota bacterium]